MPTFSTTIEDTSPVLVYSGNGGGDWRPGTSKDDGSAELYSESSFMVTTVPEANVFFTFFGSGVQIFGAKRGNHGLYQISLDSTVYPPMNGTAVDPGIFQTPLFSSGALTNDYHTVTMTNLGTGASFLDIDFLTWQTPVGQLDESLITQTVQDSDLFFAYTPSSAWNLSPPNLGMFLGGSGHFTTQAGAFVEYTFTVRAAVAIYGPVGPTCAPYSVQLDGGSPVNYLATKSFYRPQQILFQVGNLGSGQHTVRMASEALNNPALALAVDFAQVFTTSSLQPASSPNVRPGPGPGFRLSTGAIAGISAGSVALLFLSAAALFIIVRRKKSLRFKGSADQTPRTVAPISQDQPTTNGHLRDAHNLQPPPSSTGAFTFSSGETYHSQVTQRDSNVTRPNTRVVTRNTDGKYRPDLSPTSLLLPSPQGVRRTPSWEGHAPESIQELQARPSGSQQLSAGQSMIENVQQPLAAFVPLQQPSSDQTGRARIQANQGLASTLGLDTAPPQYQEDAA